MPDKRPRPRFVLRGDQTGDAISVTETWLPLRTDGPPLHHHDFDEAFCLLEGELTFSVAGGLMTAGPGEVAFAPRGVHHALANRRRARALPARLHPGGLRAPPRSGTAATGGGGPEAWALGPVPEVTVVGPPLGPRA